MKKKKKQRQFRGDKNRDHHILFVQKERAVIIRTPAAQSKEIISERCNDTARSCAMRRHSKTDGLRGTERTKAPGW